MYSNSGYCHYSARHRVVSPHRDLQPRRTHPVDGYDGAMLHQPSGRRRFLARSATVAVSLSVPALVWAQGSENVQSLSQALAWLDRLEAASGVRTSGVWPLSAVLEHLAQSIEMSMDGFPEQKSAAFQHTVGALAFNVFKWRGQMSHSLKEPIPGAAVLTPTPAWRPSSSRLRAAISRFSAHSAPLRPHFAYGLLSKTDFAIAHTLHIANHQDEIIVNALA